MKPKKYYSRKFLNSNKEGGVAAIECIVEKYGHSYGAWAEVKISDCNRQISLDFSYETDKFEARLAKIDLLVEELTKVKEQLIKHHDYQLAANAPKSKVSTRAARRMSAILGDN